MRVDLEKDIHAPGEVITGRISGETKRAVRRLYVRLVLSERTRRPTVDRIVSTRKIEVVDGDSDLDVEFELTVPDWAAPTSGYDYTSVSWSLVVVADMAGPDETVTKDVRIRPYPKEAPLSEHPLARNAGVMPEDQVKRLRESELGPRVMVFGLSVASIVSVFIYFILFPSETQIQNGGKTPVGYVVIPLSILLFLLVLVFNKQLLAPRGQVSISIENPIVRRGGTLRAKIDMDSSSPLVAVFSSAVRTPGGGQRSKAGGSPQLVSIYAHPIKLETGVQTVEFEVRSLSKATYYSDEVAFVNRVQVRRAPIRFVPTSIMPSVWEPVTVID